MDEGKGVKGEEFRAFRLPCPHCGAMFVHRLNLDGPHCGNYLPTRCSRCKEMVSRREIIRARIRGRLTVGLSCDCDRCGRASFFVGPAGVCSFCGTKL